LTKSITSSDNLNIQRRCAPIVIGELEIADRFQMKSVIDFVKLGIPVEVTASKPSPSSASDLTVVLRGGRRIEVKRGFDAGVLAQLVKHLERT